MKYVRFFCPDTYKIGTPISIKYTKGSCMDIFGLIIKYSPSKLLVKTVELNMANTFSSFEREVTLKQAEGGEIELNLLVKEIE